MKTEGETWVNGPRDQHTPAALHCYQLMIRFSRTLKAGCFLTIATETAWLTLFSIFQTGQVTLWASEARPRLAPRPLLHSRVETKLCKWPTALLNTNDSTQTFGPFRGAIWMRLQQNCDKSPFGDNRMHWLYSPLWNFWFRVPTHIATVQPPPPFVCLHVYPTPSPPLSYAQGCCQSASVLRLLSPNSSKLQPRIRRTLPANRAQLPALSQTHRTAP